MTSIRRLGWLTIAVILVLLAGCQPEVKEPTTRTTYALGTVITINLFDEGDDELMDRLVGRISEIEAKMSMQQENSEISEVTKMAGIEPVQVSEETFKVIKKALIFADISYGSFDPTIGPVVKLWDIGSENAHLPEANEIEAAVDLVDHTKVVLDEVALTVYLPEEEMSLDLGGIAKGYAADELVAILDEEGITKAMIDLGGNIFAYGEKEGGEPWNVGIQTPYDTRSAYFGYIELKNRTVVTSGPYERFFEQDGKIFHHIFDAKTGYPVETDIVSVTIVADHSMDADAMSTVLFTKSMDEGLALIESMEGVDCLYLNKDYEVTLSSGLKSIFHLTDARYKIINE